MPILDPVLGSVPVLPGVPLSITPLESAIDSAGGDWVVCRESGEHTMRISFQKQIDQEADQIEIRDQEPDSGGRLNEMRSLAIRIRG